MADRVLPGPVNEAAIIREAVSIHTRKVYSSCRDKDCIEDLPVFPSAGSAAVIESAISLRPRSAELLHVKVSVEEVSFNRGYYAVDATFFYRVRAEAFPGGNPVTGLAVFDKRAILFGSEGSARIFSSDGETVGGGVPTATVETVDPIALSMKLTERRQEPFSVSPEIPASILSAMGEELMLSPAGRLWTVTLGQFSIIRLERDGQLIIPVYDYYLPEADCSGDGGADDPCALFGRVEFPVEEFFPPDRLEAAQDYQNLV